MFTPIARRNLLSSPFKMSVHSVVILMTILVLPLQSHLAQAKTDPIDINFLYLEATQPVLSILSNLTPPPKDEGLKGAEQGIVDNNTTGRFLGQNYKLQTAIIPAPDKFNDPTQEDLDDPSKLAAFNKAKADHLAKVKADFIAQAKAALAKHDAPFVLANMNAEQLLTLSKLPEVKGRILFNVRAQDNELRNELCRTNVLHTVPSYKMRTDSLAQFLKKKKWLKIFIIEGLRKNDVKFAKSFRASAKKFRLKLVLDKKWPTSGDMRRNAAAEVPAFTQGADYDAIFIADEAHDFAQYAQYHSWLPRPFVGSQGLVPVGWNWVIEQWGAAQLQSRFKKLTSRRMTTIDYSAWAAIRTAGEAITRLKTLDIEKLHTYILGPDIKLAMFKGRAMSFRDWNGQMRQSIPLVTDRAVTALAPIKGWPHKRTELDTIGYDKNESQCKMTQ